MTTMKKGQDIEIYSRGGGGGGGTLAKETTVYAAQNEWFEIHTLTVHFFKFSILTVPDP